MVVSQLGPQSALYRARFPRTWPWTVDTDFLSAILYSTQSGNWQRGGGKGSRPKPFYRPGEAPPGGELDTSVPIRKRQTAMNDELARRRAMRERDKKRPRRSRLKAVSNG